MWNSHYHALCATWSTIIAHVLFTQLYYYACSVTTVLEHFIDAHMSFLNQQNSRMQSVSFSFYTVWNSTIWSTRQDQQSTTHSSFPGWRRWRQSSRAVEQQLDRWKLQHCCNSFPPSLCTLHFQFCNTILNELLTFLQEVMCLSSIKYKRSPAVVSNIGGIS